MDQTPVPFSYDPKSTLELVGRRTVHVWKSTSDTKHATLALTVTTSGKALLPLIVFKGKPNAPTREKIAEWAIYAKSSLTEQCIKNAWRHGNYSWFPEANNSNI